MKATSWEFANRAILIGTIFGLGFAFQSFDHENSTAVLANWVEAKWRIPSEVAAHFLFAMAALLMAIAALLRTWASSFLKAAVVYAAQVKTERLVADGPYRHVRNPLYLANILMAIALGSMMSRTGLTFAALGMTIFSYRLLFREEGELAITQGASYAAYKKAVPRLWPSFSARTAPAGNKPDWSAGFKAEFWGWGFALALAVFAVTLQVRLFFGAMAASVLILWFATSRR